jgi:predicted RNase H-like nuclease
VTNELNRDLPWFAGVDGCRAGWIVALVRSDGCDFRLHVLSRFDEIPTLPERPAFIAVDMPIGLPERIGANGRGPERAVRSLLGARRSSVFSVPSRSAVFAQDFGTACRLAAQTSDPSKKVSRQLFAIAPKIREVDAYLRGASATASSVFEVHPELAFWRLNGDRVLSEPKKRKGRLHGPGLALRRALLVLAGLRGDLAEAPPGAAADDVLDALACAVIARRIHFGLAKPFPDPPLRDEFGLQIAIWA